MVSSEDTNILTQLLTGGQRDHVTIVSGNGEVKINKFVLGSLYTIFGNLLRCLEVESDVLRLKRIKKEDLTLMFENLFQQATEFSPKEQFFATIHSILVTNKLEPDAGEEDKISRMEQDDLKLDLDSSAGFITEDHDNIDNETPIILKIRRQGKREIRKSHICGKSVDRGRMEGHLSHHKKHEKHASEDSNEKKTCPHCGKVLLNLKALQNHLRRACAGIDYGEAKCEECGKDFSSRDNLNKHIKYIHSLNKPQYICNLCGKILSSTKALDSHHQAFHEIRELKCKCKLCGKFFVDSAALRHHMKTHTEEKTSCPVCGIKVRKLKNHLDSIHTKDEDKKFQCLECGKGFMDLRKLEYHRMNIHLKTKPYNCRYGCDISYNDMSNRNAHEKRTHGKLFTTAKEEKLKEKIEILGVDEKTFTNPIV